MINKKAQTISPTFIFGIFLAIILVAFLLPGGLVKIFEIGGFLSKIPTPIWIILGILFLIKWLFGGRRR